MNAISDLAEAPTISRQTAWSDMATSKPTVSPESAARRVISGKASWIR
ncbi:Uncharacterised protein [Bordetella pertussis]|nr:Uncharacterised protein [Bordetella pertussis]CPL64695.1 Uncharacterised protein [Bordetella pertussis]